MSVAQGTQGWCNSVQLGESSSWEDKQDEVVGQRQHGRQGFWDRAGGSPRPTLVTAAHMCIISMPGVPGEGHRGGDFLGGESSWGLEMGPICLPAVCSFTEHLEGSGE